MHTYYLCIWYVGWKRHVTDVPSGWLVTVVPFWLSEVVIKLVLTKETGESIILVNIPGVYV